MTNPDEAGDAPDSFGDLPLQPTGSGVADLEIAYEQMKLAEVDEPDLGRTSDDLVASSGPAGAGETESEAHPS